jgi:uncharacterized Zn finger protein (UPF0148 family)
MLQNIITTLNLESHVADMKIQNLSEREIAEKLSLELHKTITKSSVHRYLSGNVRLCQEAVEVNNKLKVKVAEAELDTIVARRELIDKIRELASTAEEFGDIKTALYALSQAINALDSLDKRLGKLSDRPDINVNIQLNSVTLENQTYQNFMLNKICPACKAVLIQDLEKAV